MQTAAKGPHVLMTHAIISSSILQTHADLRDYYEELALFQLPSARDDGEGARASGE